MQELITSSDLGSSLTGWAGWHCWAQSPPACAQSTCPPLQSLPRRWQRGRAVLPLLPPVLLCDAAPLANCGISFAANVLCVHGCRRWQRPWQQRPAWGATSLPRQNLGASRQTACLIIKISIDVGQRRPFRVLTIPIPVYSSLYCMLIVDLGFSRGCPKLGIRCDIAHRSGGTPFNTMQLSLARPCLLARPARTAGALRQQPRIR